MPFLVTCRYLSDSYVFIHFSFCIRMENNMHQSRHHGLLYERVDGLREWWPACLLPVFMFFTQVKRNEGYMESPSLWQLADLSWKHCHVLSYWTNGPHLPKANIKHTERKHCVDSDRQCRVSSTNTVVTLTSTLVQLFAILMEVQSIGILLLRDSSKSEC